MNTRDLYLKSPIQNRSQLKFDMEVFHTKIYDGNEPLIVVGIRKDQVELKGDYSGVGLDNSSCWLPIDGVLIKLNNL